MKIDLNSKVALITGAAREGLGRACALALAEANAKVVLIDKKSSEETVNFLSEKGFQAKSYVCDITDSSALKVTLETIHQEMGGLHILVNNASIVNTIGLFQDLSEEAFNLDVEVNLKGTANITRLVWPYLLAQKGGRVVFISSIAGLRGGLGQASYAATKASVIGLGKSLALEGAKAQITVNMVAPGVIETPTSMSMIKDETKERMKKLIPLRRFAKTSDIAHTVCFLCSEQASYITGQVLTVDGGAGLFVF